MYHTYFSRYFCLILMKRKKDFKPNAKILKVTISEQNLTTNSLTKLKIYEVNV